MSYKSTADHIVVMNCVSVNTGDCPAVPVCQEYESRKRSIDSGCLSEVAAFHLHHPTWHDQPSPLSRCVHTSGRIIIHMPLNFK